MNLALGREFPATEYGSGPHLCQTYQQPADRGGIPLLAATKGLAPVVGSVPSPQRYC